MIRIFRESKKIAGNLVSQETIFDDLLKNAEAKLNGLNVEVQQFYVDRTETEISLIFIVKNKIKEEVHDVKERVKEKYK